MLSYKRKLISESKYLIVFLLGSLKDKSKYGKTTLYFSHSICA